MAKGLPLAQVDTAATALWGLEGQEVSDNKEAPYIDLAAINTFGIDAQTDKTLEELGELATALIQYRYGRITIDDLRSEIADVLITVGQLRLHYGATAVDDIRDVKLARLKRLVADQVAAKPEPKPVKPMLRWEAGKGDELILYRWSRQIGSVTRSPYYADQWVAFADSNLATTHAHKETAINIVCMELGLSVCEVPLWKP